MVAAGEDKAEEAAGQADTETPTSIRVLKSSDLLANDREIIIDHGGDRYRLRRTSKGKLILTK